MIIYKGFNKNQSEMKYQLKRKIVYSHAKKGKLLIPDYLIPLEILRGEY